MPTESRSNAQRAWFGFDRIDRYVLMEVLPPALGSMAILLFIFLMFQVLRLAESLIVHGVPFLVLLKILGNMSIIILVLALPMALLTGTLSAFGRLSSDSELVAMKACGISLARLSRWPILVAFLVALLCLYLSLEVAPRAEKDTNNLLVRVANTKVVSSIKEGTFTTGFFDLLVYADKADPKTSKMEKVFIFDERQPKNPMTIVAQKGEIVPIEGRSELGASIVFHLENGNIHRNEFESETYQKIDFGSYLLFLKVLEGEDNSTIRPKMMGLRELLKWIRSEPPGSGPRLDYETELWRRVQMALIAVPFVLLAIGYGTIRTRAIRAGSTLISLIIIVSFWIFVTVAIAVSKKGAFPPVLMMAVPTLLLSIQGWLSFKKASW